MQNLCLFAHYDKHGQVDAYVWRYLEAIRKLDFAVVFISTAALASEEVERLGALCHDVILRENAGLDFASWVAGLAKHRPPSEGRLLLANDSVYGPVGALAPAYARLTSGPADFYGFVESREIAPHLQSWFLLFEPWVALHPAFQEVLGLPFAAMTKNDIIMQGEIGLSRRLLEAGFRYRALFEIGGAGKAAGRYTVNPMHIYWRELLLDAGVPFVKIELLRDNPFGIEDEDAILRTLASLDGQSCPLISSHLARTKRQAAAPASQGAAGGQPLKERIIRRRYDLLRRGYALSRQRRLVAERLNLLGLDLLTRMERRL